MAKIRIPEGQGYDIIIWQRTEESPTWVASYTKDGYFYLQKFIPQVVNKKAFQLEETPFNVIDLAPKNLKIGGMSPKTRVVMRLNPRLH